MDKRYTGRARRLGTHLTGLCSEGRCPVATSGDQKADTSPSMCCFSVSNADAAISFCNVGKQELAFPSAQAYKRTQAQTHWLFSVDPPLATPRAKDSFRGNEYKGHQPQTSKLLPKTKPRSCTKRKASLKTLVSSHPSPCSPPISYRAGDEDWVFKALIDPKQRTISLYTGVNTATWRKGNALQASLGHIV